MPRRYDAKMFDIKHLRATAEKCKNWGKWGPDDEAGTLNYVQPEDITNAGKLIKRGKAFSLGLNFDKFGPQKGLWGNRFNPIHTMLATGTDAVAGNQDKGGLRYADDMVSLPLQCGTQWDGLGHIMYYDHMWNGYDCRTVTSAGASKGGIEKTKEKMIGRGVLLDVPKALGMKWLPDGFAVTNEILDFTAEHHGVEVRRGDFLLVRTGHVERKFADYTSANSTKIDQIVPIDAVVAVEVYARTGNLPAELNLTDNSCGLIAIWTGARK